MIFYSLLITTHSILRWIFLLMIIYAVINAIKIWKLKGSFTSTDRLINTLVVIISHVQLVIGLSLYIVSPKVVFSSFTMSNPTVRFFTVEHITFMLLSIVFLTVSNIKSKRNPNTVLAVKTVAIGFTIALVLILISVPWPFRHLGNGWI